MRKYRLSNIVNFLTEHGWRLVREGRIFNEYAPPNSLNLEGFHLDVPVDERDNGFQKYIHSIVDIITDVYDGTFTADDLETFFSTERNIFSLRMKGYDTQAGSIQLTRFRNAINIFYQSLRQSVVYAITERPIFGQARAEANTYLKACRSKQTAFGSYVLKFELPENNMTLFEEKSVPSLLFDAIEFIFTISRDLSRNDINEDFVVTYSNIINVELLEAVVKMIKDSRLYEGEIQLHSFNKNKTLEIELEKPQIKKMEEMVADIKEILLKRIPLEVQGIIVRLASREVEQTGRIWMEIEVGEEIRKLEVVLSSDNYKDAVEAHKNGREVYVKGIAQELRVKLLIEELEIFKVIY